MSVLVALDLSAAFDTVDHGILCNILEHDFGIKDGAIRWIKSYLKDRQMCVKVDKVKSPLHSFNFSVPQGSCIGPHLFNLYASSITECVGPQQHIAGYADDHIIKDTFNPSSATEESACISRLEVTLDKVVSWMQSNVLKMNTDKTEVALFGSHAMMAKTRTTSICVDGDIVKTCDKLKYLGVWLDNNLNLQHHIQTKVKTTVNCVRSIAKIRDFIDDDTSKLLAPSLILTHLDYANCLLFGLPANSIEKLQRVQNWAAKVVLKRSKYDSSKDALRELHWLPVQERIKFKILCMVFKCLNNMAPQYLANLLSLKQFSRTTRSSHTVLPLTEPFTKKSTFASRAFSVAGPSLWNELPCSIKSIDNFNAFKNL